MKKYILLIGMFCLVFSHGKASDNNLNEPQDSVWSFNKNIDIDLAELKESLGELNLDSNVLAAMDFSFDIDSITRFAMNEGVKASMKDLSTLGNDIFFELNSNSKKSLAKEDDDRTPTRIEKKTFSNISEIEFFHSYGSIVVKESSSKQIELEIQYFDTQRKKASCSITTTGGLLTISTEKGSDIRNESSSKSSNFSMSLGSLGKNGKEKINYIISIPRNISLNVDLKYGNIKMDRFHDAFTTNLSYSDLSASGFGGIKPQIKAKYSDVRIDEAKDLYISASYTDIRVKKADKVEITGNYNDYSFGDIQTLTTGNSSSYGDMKIGTVGNFQGNIKYADVVIETLLSNMDVTTAYGDITIRNVSTSLKNINVRASYADVTISLPQGMSVGLDVNISYGDLLISKKYDVKYTESAESNNRIVKKGQIGTRTPSATIKASNSYADIRIK